MSIVQLSNNNRIIKKISNGLEYFKRELISINASYKIYFPYHSALRHPVFSELVKHPPLNYTNRKNARLYHQIQGVSKADLGNKNIVEVIDHALSILAPYYGHSLSCNEYSENVNLARTIYESPNIKKVLFISEGQKRLFENYFPIEGLVQKSRVIPVPWKDNIKFKSNNFGGKRRYLLIASDYITKGVPLVLEAWKKFATSNPGSELSLVSHDLPQEKENQLHESVTLYREAPLTRKNKERLYAQSDVVIATTLTDGVTAIEATSFGKPVIVFRNQHSNDFVNRENGVVIDVPINIYDEGYGKIWKTNEEYSELIKQQYIKGGFDEVVERLIHAFTIFRESKTIVQYTQNAVEKYYEFHTIDSRNRALMEVYEEVYE